MVKIYRICAARCSDNCVEKSEMGSKCKIRHSHNGLSNTCCGACYRLLLVSRPGDVERKLRGDKAPVRTYNRKPLGTLEENCSLQVLGERQTPRPVATPCSLQNADAPEGAMDCDDEQPPAENEAERAGSAGGAGGAGGVGGAMDCDDGQRRTDPTR